MSRRTINNIAALVAGFGTGYMQTEKQKRDQERQDKKDKADEEDRQLRRDDIAMQKKREADALAGFDAASKMKVGELRNEQGVVDNSEAAWQQRIATTPDNEGNLPTAEVAAATAPIYAQEAAKKGSEKWLSSSAANAILGEVKPTSRGDIKRTEAEAMAKLGITGLPQAMAMKEKADRFKGHPLWPEYEETRKILVTARDMQDDDRVDILEERLTDLANQIGRDLGIPDERRDDPTWQKWDYQ